MTEEVTVGRSKYKPYQATPWQRRIDNALGVLSPKWGLNRMVAREKAHWFRYMAAQPTSARPNSMASSSGEWLRMQREKMQVMWNAIDMVDNSGLCSGILLKFPIYICGTLRWQAKTGDKAVNEQYQQYIKHRTLPSNIDVTRRFSLRTMCMLDVKSIMLKGDVGTNIVRGDDGPVLQGIEANRIGDPYRWDTSDVYVRGLVLDEAGAIDSVRVYHQDRRSGTYKYDATIPMRDDNGFPRFLFFTNPISFDDYRGVSVFKHAIDNDTYITQMRQYELQALLWASSQSGIYHTKSGGLPEDLPYSSRPVTDRDGHTINTYEVRPNTVIGLGEAENISMFQHDRPSPNVIGMYENTVLDICNGIGCTKAFGYNMEGLTGPAVRMCSAQDARAIQVWQEMLREQKLDPVIMLLLGDAIAKGDLPYHPNWLSWDWFFPAKPTIDVGRESAANIEEIFAGVNTRANVTAEANLGDVSEITKQLGHEVEDQINQAIEVAGNIGKGTTWQMVYPLMFPPQHGGRGGGMMGDPQQPNGATDDGVSLDGDKQSLKKNDRIQLFYREDQSRDDHGRFADEGRGSEEAGYQHPGEDGQHARQRDADVSSANNHPVITKAEARGNSRPVSTDEFQALRDEGMALLDERSKKSSPTIGLDKDWSATKDRAYRESRTDWGGSTIDTHTGEFVKPSSGFALSVRQPGQDTIRIPSDASRAQFGAAMDKAKATFTQLSDSGYHLGVFNDVDHKSIDIDPVLIVDSRKEVDAIGAYTHAVGGAYDFSRGNGHFPPHVDEQHGRQSDIDVGGGTATDEVPGVEKARQSKEQHDRQSDVDSTELISDPEGGTTERAGRLWQKAGATKDSEGIWHKSIGGDTSSEAKSPELSAIDKRLVDYKPDRSLSDPSKTERIDSRLSNARYQPYSQTPFFEGVNHMQGTPHADSTSIGEYVEARDKLFNKQPVIDVPLDKVVVTQPVVNKDRVSQLVSNPETGGTKPISAVRYNGETYILNGHHRAVADIERGEKSIKAHVLEYVDPPKNDADIPRYVDELSHTQRYQEATNTMAQYGSTQDERESWSQRINQKDGKYTPERQALHNKIVASMLNPKASVPQDQTPSVTFLIGASGAGKSSVGLPYARDFGEATYLNPDDIRGNFPEYNGANAPATQRESKDVHKQLGGEALAKHQNMIEDVTGSNTAKLDAQATAWGQAGYNVNVVFVDLPLHMSAERVWNRYQNSGRFVDMDYLQKDVDHNPIKTYAKLKQNPVVKHWISIDNSGDRPKITDQGQRDE